MRQAHISPALNEGLQGVVVVDDLSVPDTGSLTDPAITPGVRAAACGLDYTAATQPQVCLFNPAGSGIIMAVDAFYLSTSALNICRAGRVNQFLGATVGPANFGVLNSDVPGSGGAVANKVLVQVLDSAGFSVQHWLWAGWVGANSVQPCAGLRWPIFLGEGLGLLFLFGAGAAQVEVGAQWREIERQPAGN